MAATRKLLHSSIVSVTTINLKVARKYSLNVNIYLHLNSIFTCFFFRSNGSKDSSLFLYWYCFEVEWTKKPRCEHFSDNGFSFIYKTTTYCTIVLTLQNGPLNDMHDTRTMNMIQLCSVFETWALIEIEAIPMHKQNTQRNKENQNRNLRKW